VIEDIGAHDIETRYGIPAVHFERMTLARARTPNRKLRRVLTLVMPR